MNCYFDHKDHNIFEYQIIIPIKEKVNEDLVELRNKIDQIDQFMKEVNEKFIEQFLDNYDSKHQRNIRDMKIHYSNVRIMVRKSRYS